MKHMLELGLQITHAHFKQKNNWKTATLLGKVYV